MNDNLRIAIRWLAIAGLALFFVGVLVGVVLPDSSGLFIPTIGCPGSNRCLIGFSSNPLLFVGIFLAVVVTALSLVTLRRGTPRAWRVLLLILTVLLVLSPVALYVPRVDIAVIVVSVVAVLALLIAVAATFGDRMTESS
jgi:hypothetical protein